MKLFDAIQVHLGLNHIPVILTALAAVILAVAMLTKNDSVAKTALWIFLGAGLFCIPVYLSGEGTEETVEKIAGISEKMIEEHEEIAKWALIGCSVNGLLALLGLASYTRLSRIIKPLILAIAIITSIILIRTAHEGGLIRHSELNPSSPSVTNSPGETERGSENEHED